MSAGRTYTWRPGESFDLVPGGGLVENQLDELIDVHRVDELVRVLRARAGVLPRLAAGRPGRRVRDRRVGEDRVGLGKPGSQETRERGRGRGIEDQRGGRPQTRAP